jgi:hypothetical protein
MTLKSNPNSRVPYAHDWAQGFLDEDSRVFSYLRRAGYPAGGKHYAPEYVFDDIDPKLADVSTVDAEFLKFMSRYILRYLQELDKR